MPSSGPNRTLKLQYGQCSSQTGRMKEARRFQLRFETLHNVILTVNDRPDDKSPERKYIYSYVYHLLLKPMVSWTSKFLGRGDKNVWVRYE